MSNTATLKSLKDRALDYADMTGSDFPDTDRLTDYVNDGLSELHDLIVNHNGEEYFRKSTTFTLVSGTEEYALPLDFYKSIHLYYTSNSRRFKVERWQPMEIDGYRSSPLSTGSVEMWYVPQFKAITGAKASVDQIIPQGWEDYAALHAAIRLAMREESDPQALMSERDRLRSRIIALLSPRDAGIPDSVGDYYGRWDGTRNLLRFEDRYFKYRIMGRNVYFIEIEYLGA